MNCHKSDICAYHSKYEKKNIKVKIEKGKKSSNRNSKKVNQQNCGQNPPLTYLASRSCQCLALIWLFRLFFEEYDLSQNWHLNMFSQVLFLTWVLVICNFKDCFVAYVAPQKWHLCLPFKIWEKEYKSQNRTGVEKLKKKFERVGRIPVKNHHWLT